MRKALVVARREFKESKWTKLLNVRSDRLSAFHGRDVYLQASVTLPASYTESPKRRFPTIFTIPGFGGTHHQRPRSEPIDENNDQGVEFLRVTLDPSCPLGHHVFADSANNGPVGTALIEELIPAFDKRFRSIAEPQVRGVSVLLPRLLCEVDPCQGRFRCGQTWAGEKNGRQSKQGHSHVSVS